MCFKFVQTEPKNSKLAAFRSAGARVEKKLVRVDSLRNHPQLLGFPFRDTVAGLDAAVKAIVFYVICVFHRFLFPNDGLLEITRNSVCASLGVHRIGILAINRQSLLGECHGLLGIENGIGPLEFTTRRCKYPVTERRPNIKTVTLRSRNIHWRPIGQ